jgi:hypothetical protein
LRRRFDASRDQLALVCREYGWPELVLPVRQVSLGGSDAVRGALALALRGQREDTDDGDDWRSDLRTPIRQSEEFYRALKMLKKETLLVRMPDEYHGWRRPSHQLLQQLYLMAWFEKYSNKNKSVPTDTNTSQK